MDDLTLFMLCMIAVPLIGLIAYSIANRPRTRSGPATVEAHRIGVSGVGCQYSSGWLYMVTFRFSDGDTLELYTLRSDYETIQDGQHGTVFWDGDQLMDFIPDQI